MSNHLGFARYRAMLGDETDREFAIVVVLETGSISWTAISEQEFNDADCADLPEDLFETVNGAFQNLRLLGDDEP